MSKLWRKPFDAREKAPKPASISIDRDKCKGCGYCTEFCPREALVMSQEINAKGYTLAAVADESKCLYCGLCEIICPEFAIKVHQVENGSGGGLLSGACSE
jgi:2-oxoglutarate ferredoxin oxidoreductase subunit delta